MSIKVRFSSSDDDSSDSWVSISDMMAGLMMIFLLLAVWHSARVSGQNAEIIEQRDRLTEQRDKIAEQNDLLTEQTESVDNIVTVWKDLEEAIYQALLEEFRDDLPRWQAEIERETLTIRFLAPRIFFEQDSAELKPRFEMILLDFFPRYIRVLHDGTTDDGVRFSDNIREVRIEGHTSSEYGDLAGRDAFIENMRLSQARTRATMEYVLDLNEVAFYETWIVKTVTANGLSSGRTLLSSVTGEEDRESSRRVEFTVRTRTKDALFDILNTLAAQNAAVDAE